MARYLTYEKRKDYLWILVGTAVMALSTNLFFVPENLVCGGFTGISIIIKYLTAHLMPGGFPLWATNIILNVPLLLFSIRLRGWSFVRKTLGATLLFSAWLYIIPVCPVITGDLILTAVFGGATMGAGLGLVFLGKSTTGGTDTVAAIIQHFIPHRSVAMILPFCDGAVILLAAWIFGIRLTLYAVISVFVCGIISENVVSGFRNAYLAYIISDRHNEIASEIMRVLDRGATMLPGTGMYTKNDKPVLFCAVSKKQAVLLKDIVSEIDPSAFMIVTAAKEIRGEGFLDYSKEEL